MRRGIAGADDLYGVRLGKPASFKFCGECGAALRKAESPKSKVESPPQGPSDSSTLRNTWKLHWPAKVTKSGKKTKKPHEVILVDEERDIVQRAWAARRPDCDYLFHVNGMQLGPMLSELRRTCELLGIPYGRGKGIVFHDTRHSAVTNLVGSGTGEAVAMTITGHVDPNVFKRYNVRCDDVQAEALDRQSSYLAGKRGTTPAVPTLNRKA